MQWNLSHGNNRQQWLALALLSITLVLSMTTWFSAAAVIPQLREEWSR